MKMQKMSEVLFNPKQSLETDKHIKATHQSNHIAYFSEFLGEGMRMNGERTSLYCLEDYY
jgi:hypothetical protein